MYAVYLKKLIIIAGLALVLGMIPVSANAQDDGVKDEIFGTLMQTFEKAEAQNVDLFSPKNYKLAQDYYDKALKAYKSEKSLKTIREFVDKSQDYLNAAMENIEIARITLGDLIALRQEAIDYEVDKSAPKSFASAESKFKAASVKIESGSTRSAKAASKEAEKSYRLAVIRVLQDDYLKSAREMLKDVKKDVFKDTYKSALDGLNETEAYLKYQAKADFAIPKIFPEVHQKISEALAVAEIKFPDLVIGGKVLNSYDTPAAVQKTEPAAETKVKEKSKKSDTKVEKVYKELPPISTEILNQEQEIKRLISPSSQKSLAQAVPDFEVLAFGLESESALTEAANQTVQKLYEEGDLGAVDIDKASFLIVLNAVNEMDEDIKVILDEIDKMEANKQEIADLKTRLSEYSNGSSEPVLEGDMKEFSYKVESEWDKTPNLGLEYIRTPQIKLRSLNKIEKENLSAEMQALDNLNVSLDDISQIVALKLQMAMDRRAKYQSTLSSIMKAMSQTQKDVINNMK